MKTKFLWLPLVGMLTMAPAAQAAVDVSFGIRVPGLSIGINMPSYPSMVLVPGLPVYYLPESDSNYFYYDGLYWSYQDDYWYTSDWYDGPWTSVSPYDVPFFILRVPVAYYVRPPHFFVGWRSDQAPHWGEHWGRDWQRGRRGWDHWDRGHMPRPAPLPSYQHRYQSDNYPHSAQQEYSIRSEHFNYRPQDEFNRRYLNRPHSDQRMQRRPRQTDARPDTRPQTPRQNGRQQPDERVQAIRPRDSRRQQPNLHRTPQGQRNQPDRRREQPNTQSRSNGRRQECDSNKQNSDIRCKVHR